MVPRRLFSTVAFFALLSGCGPKGPPAIGEAYVGPATLNLRKELAPKSPVVATLKHGDRLEVLQLRRRFVRVRTESGAMGWTDSRQMLSTEQMKELRQLAEIAAKLPAQGAATVYEPLNVHTDPLRVSPSLTQIPEGGLVEMVAHRITARNAPPRPPSAVLDPRPPAPPKKRKPESRRLPSLPMPSPPGLPPNWLELSRSAQPETRAEAEFAKESSDEVARQSAKEREEAEEKPVPMEDWSLVRLKDGKVGWVLTRNLVLALPDEVAQWGEGHRITSYFELADIKDADQIKHYWLWTTITRGGQPFEFDSFRVFTWSLRRHRYETAYIERRIKGFFPVEATKGTGERGAGATFSVILEKDGQFIRKKFLLNGVRVVLAGEGPYEPPQQDGPMPFIATSSSAPGLRLRPPVGGGLLDKIKKGAESLVK